jgi:hypothetical protein
MAAQAYTDLFNTAINTQATTLNAITGLVCITDPRNVQAPCILLDAMSFTAFNANIVDISIPVTVISLGPSNADAYRNALNVAAKVLAAKVAVTDGRPTTLTIGGVEYPALSLNIQMKASTT